jgi:hypothetical protein
MQPGEVFLSRYPGTPLPPLPTDLVAGFPVMRADGDGRIHLFWASPTEPGPVSVLTFADHLQVLWHATLESGVWSQPQKVFEARRLNWGEERSLLHDEKTGLFHIIVPSADTNGAPVLSYIRGRDAEWRVVTLPVAATYSDIIQLQDGTLLVVALGAGQGAAGTASSLFLLRSADNGSTWATPQLLGHVGGVDHASLQLLQSSAGGLEATWLQREDPTSKAASIRRLLGDEEGRDWTLVPALQLPPGEVLSVQMGTSPCGYSTAIVELFDRTSVSLHQVRWTSSDVSTQRLFPDQKASGAPALALLGTAHRLLWSGARNDDDAAVFMTAMQRGC